MVDKEQVQEAAGAAERLLGESSKRGRLGTLGFCLSLLPVPVVQQAGQLLDRWVSKKEHVEELDAVCARIEELGHDLDRLDSLDETIARIAEVAAENEAIRDDLKRISEALAEEDSEFVMETEDSSYQELARSVVKAARVLISAKRGSTNVIEDSEIESKRTHLHASGQSRNFVDKTSFVGEEGSVGMDGISTEGDVSVSDSSIGLGPDSAIIFGGNPNLVSGDCPFCGETIQADRRKLTNYSRIQCPACSREMSFTID